MSSWQLELSYHGLHLLPPNASGEVYAVYEDPEPDTLQVVAYVYAPDFFRHTHFRQPFIALQRFRSPDSCQ